MKHIAESAGRIMVREVPIVQESATVREVEDLLRAGAASFATINYLYIVDDKKVLKGVLSVRELFSLSPHEHVREHMETKLVVARPHSDQERVAHLALKHNLKAIPVVSREQELLGVVPSDVILTVLNEEHTEDVLRFAGVNRKHEGGVGKLLQSQASIVHVKTRLPWLILGLGGGVLAAVVVGWFEGTLENQLILAAFIPAIVYMADAVGSQTQMLFIRSLAIDHLLSVKSYLWRELKVNFLLGCILSSIVFALGYFWLQSFVLSCILSLALFLTVWSTVLVAIALPWFLHSRGQDPAIASGPLATVVRDIMSLCIYLGVASLLLP